MELTLLWTIVGFIILNLLQIVSKKKKAVTKHYLCCPIHLKPYRKMLVKGQVSHKMSSFDRDRSINTKDCNCL
ncbi:uncharacterized protein BX663DRAFT_583765 [Cokeromyces recurvatus]|uniref:uncharacterized protein n=1 Tax=Cokeromyces recurvatus TaxID=90255 RepID=UPI00221EBCC1|nr:uncharacterized protein BX663DRAFT_583765 [Cokeromyces recurvatus]KAI7905637.1 hypothetical protein BX663DRAFT_583765 [Cokeromyces recurvatus]